MGYATASDLIARYDVRTLGDLCADDGTRVAAASLTANPKLVAALDSATGQVNAACLQGERYTVADLAGLTVDSSAYLVTLVCAIAYAALWTRRHYQEENQTRTEALSRADEALRQLRTGERVFDVTEQKEAGRANVDTVSRVTIANDWGLASDTVRGHLYPQRRSYRNQ